MTKANDKADKTVTAKSNLQSDKLQAIKVAMEQIDKQFGTGSIMKLGTSQHMDIKSIPTSAMALDLALGIGGFPCGRITEIYGPEASGKTTVCLHVIAEAQKKGGTAAFIDAEHALDPARAKEIGVNLDELLISQPDTGEQALEIAETLIRSGAVDVIVVDSVAALVPKAEIEGEMGDAVMGMQARLMSQALRKLTGAISKSNTVMVFTNQLRMKIGVMFGNPETTAGGQALKFYSSVRIDMRKIGNITEGEVIVGSRHRAKIVKNKVSPPFKVAEFDIMTSGGISKSGGILDVAVEQTIIEKSGSFFKYEGVLLAQGREATKVVLEEKPELMKRIEKDIWDQIKKVAKEDAKAEK
ncbi:MAG: Protein RecA [Microgenomates group bacterium GW2011_GWA2_46_7]|nr:MAG: Protein RecA [Microgenomates group bacterium GW2011_GWA2_46_7]KKU46697.1 MAG: Protein RecA [Microgenomates group bacterium GW2011_GWC2_46_7]